MIIYFQNSNYRSKFNSRNLSKNIENCQFSKSHKNIISANKTFKLNLIFKNRKSGWNNRIKTIKNNRRKKRTFTFLHK
jgi:hypothetical protein